MELDAAADRLYALPPEDFVAERTALAGAARAGGDRDLARAIGGLRKPTLSAWALNRLAAAPAAELTGLLELAAELRAAWGRGDPVGPLQSRRTRAVEQAVEAAAALAAAAGHPLTGTALREVQDALEAAVVDPAAARTLAAGRLVRPQGAAAVLDPGARRPAGPAARPERRTPQEPDGAATERLRAALRDAEEASAAWAERLTAARAEVDEQAAAAVRLEQELTAARRGQGAAERRLRGLEKDARRAERAVADARDRLRARSQR